MPTRKRNPKLNKSRANASENRFAKELSVWMFGDGDVLKRHPSSGAEKSVYSGDIYPMKQMGWKTFPFHLEIKDGYVNKSHPLAFIKQVSEWYADACSKTDDKPDERIIWVIWKLPNKGTLIFSDIVLDNVSEILSFKYLNKSIQMYNYKDVLDSSFKSHQEINCLI